MTWRAECCAVDADTGRKCRRLAHTDVVHRHERGTFTRLAAPGQTHFAHRDALDVAATRSRGAEGLDEFTDTQLKRFERKKRRKVSAHLGDVTVMGGDDRADRRATVPADVKREVSSYLRKGTPQHVIAKGLGVSQSTVSRLARSG